MDGGLVALEFSGSRQSLDRVAEAGTELGWRVESKTDKSLRILPPSNYDPDKHFGPLLQRIEEVGARDIGLKLIGPNGPVGPEG